MQKLTLVALLACPLFGGCAAAALTAGAVILNEDFQAKSVSAIVPSDPQFVWKSTLNSLSSMTRAMIHRDDDLMQARTNVDYGQLQVQVREVAVGQTQIQVLAKKAMVFSPELSTLTLERIVADFDSLRSRSEIGSESASYRPAEDWQETVPSGVYVGTGGIELEAPQATKPRGNRYDD
ncbi:MAG: hypothetical protein H6830_03220 [Planctomycetes bacterium]|nr:hypothetical protein [Planctomycetota bacterium]MCB9910697.1 hypothetical protein [Planctomycetota bacterium]HPF14873.1 hypothetical protein [Planctomycetota bacterium]